MIQTMKPGSKPQHQTQPKRLRRNRPSFPEKPALRFSPTAWAKLLYFLRSGETEVGGFGVTSARDPLFVEEFCTVQQEVSVASVSFEDTAVADFFEDQVDAGRKPEQFGRIWLHTHPGDSPTPSLVDEETFCRVFGKCQWAVMFILARTGKSYARLSFNVGPSGQFVIPVEVDYLGAFGASDHHAWEKEYQANLKAQRFEMEPVNPLVDPLECSMLNEWQEDLADMEEEERRRILEDFGATGLLTEEEEVCYEW